MHLLDVYKHRPYSMNETRKPTFGKSYFFSSIMFLLGLRFRASFTEEYSNVQRLEEIIMSIMITL